MPVSHDAVQPTRGGTADPLGSLLRTVAPRVSAHGLRLVVTDRDGASRSVGDGPAKLTIVVTSDDGRRALLSRSELAIAEAYMHGALDFEGDLVAAMALRQLLADRRWWIAGINHLQGLILGRRLSNPGWISKHYDSGNVQLIGLDDRYGLYTPGSYADPADSLEQGAVRKLDDVASALRLEPGAALLDVGCGWGGLLRYAAARGVVATGLTLSRDQASHARATLARDGLEARVLYTDFFAHRPATRFDAISLMGVIEDLSDYDRVMRRLSRWLAPGGRVYLDFASSRRRWGVPSFVTKHVWPGRFRMVYLPDLVRAAQRHGFEVLSLQGDRKNYELWTTKVHDRWVERKAEVLRASDERTWRAFRLLQAGTAAVMGDAGSRDSAHRLVLAHRTGGVGEGAGQSQEPSLVARPADPTAVGSGS